MVRYCGNVLVRGNKKMPNLTIMGNKGYIL